MKLDGLAHFSDLELDCCLGNLGGWVFGIHTWWFDGDRGLTGCDCGSLLLNVAKGFSAATAESFDGFLFLYLEKFKKLYKIKI